MIPSNKSPSEVEIFFFYQQAINNLEQGRIDDGKAQLKSLLHSNQIKNQDHRTIYYAILISLAEVYGRSNSIQEKCEALKYYHESNSIIEDCWETNRKMAIIFRQIGLIPRALHLTQKALEVCQQNQGKLILYYQICCLAFLINELDLFNQYLEIMPDENKLKQQLLELDLYIKEQKKSLFVNELLEERTSISKKIASIPKEYLTLDYFYQEYECEIYIQESNPQKLFKKIKRLLLNNLQIDENTDEVHQKDLSILLKTFFVIKSKDEKSVQKDKHKEQIEKNIKQRLKQKLFYQNDQNIQAKFSLQSILQKENSKSVEIFKNCGLNMELISIFGKNTILQDQQVQNLEQNQAQQISNNALGQYLISKLKEQKFYILNLINQLTELIFRIPEDLNQDQEVVDKAQKDLVRCYIWAQYFMNEFSNDPKIELKILSQLFKEFKLRIKNEKTKTKKQNVKLKNLQRLIFKFNDKLLFQISFKKDQKEEQISQTKEFKMIMSQIHNEFNILKNFSPLANQNQLNKSQQLGKILELSLNEILEFWESPFYLVEKGEQTSNQVAKIKAFIKEENKLFEPYDIYQQIINVCIKQLYFRKSQDQCKQVFALIKSIFESLYKSVQVNNIIALCYLKLSFIYGALEEEASQPLVLFLSFHYKKLEFPYKELFLITTLQQRQIKLRKFFELFNLNLVIKDLINLRIKMKFDYQYIFKNLIDQFQDSFDVQYYLMQQINEKPGIYGHCIVKKNQVQIETQPMDPGKNLIDPENYSSESEEDYCFTYPYQVHYKEIKLKYGELNKSFKIGSKQYKISVEKQKYISSHKISINLGDPQISKQIKNISKELLKQKFLLCTKQLKKTFIVFFFENYYFDPIQEQNELSEEEIKFIGYFLPICFNQFEDKKKVSIFTTNVILKYIPKKIDSQIYQYANALNQQIFSKQPLKQMPKFNEMKDQIVQQKLQNEYMANIYYLLQITGDDEKGFMYILLAIAFNEIPYFWNYLYMKIFHLAYNQLNQKVQTSDFDWFISQKKIQVHLQKWQSLIHLFEYRFIMDLLKAQQRQLEYQSQPNEKNYQKVQQAYQFLLSQNQINIPLDIYELQHNFRAILLIEKKIMRKLRSVSIQRIIQSISNYSQINKLIIQMKEQKLTYFYNSSEGEIETISDLQINVYKYLRRFIKTNNGEGLKLLIETIENQIPLLMEVTKDIEEFQYCFTPELRTFKSNLKQDQNEQLYDICQSKHYQQKINVVMGNLSLFFERIKQKLGHNAPQRYVIEAIYYLCHIQLQNKNLTKDKLENLIQIISIIYSPQIKDLVRYQKQYGNEYSEQDQVLRYYYHHDLVFFYLKQKIVKLFIRILFANQKWKELLELLEQLPKNFDLRGYQICFSFIENQKYFSEPQLLQDVLCHIDYFLKRNQQYVSLNENQEYEKMFLKFYDVFLFKQQKNNKTITEKEKQFQAKKFIDHQVRVMKKGKRDYAQCQDNQNFIEIC
ncbi:unnamed protein product [Paramecium sonneborni]|uniref:Tetratricopeptide repeat protein n=1 Tax=Paramecium sonneborni TaxID=65129 RepID=A0A8S1LCN2_9CILI|nr:unnamed protein product [Paramecium sonneborni]